MAAIVLSGLPAQQTVAAGSAVVSSTSPTTIIVATRLVIDVASECTAS